ncbi:MAG TPA: hypothetical protein VGB66_08240 [Longimicrobium sp.]
MPAAVTRDPAEGLEGDRILSEFPGEFGVLLWRTARDVVLWAGTPAARRAGLFSPEASGRRMARLLDMDLPEGIPAFLDTLASQMSTPEKGDAEVLAWCCRQVARWAAGRGCPGTATFYAQTAALCSPGDAAPALDTGRLALADGQRPRGESWLRRAIALARRSRQWDAYAAAHVDLGNLYEHAGESDRARRYYRRACATGRRYGMRECRLLAGEGLRRIAMAEGCGEPAAEGER